MNILQVSTWDLCGGAEKISWMLHHTYQAFGHNAWIMVGYRQTPDQNIFLLPNDAYRSQWAQLWIRIGKSFFPLSKRFSLIRRLCNIFNYLGEPQRWLPVKLGREDFHFPATRYLLDISSQTPDIVHCHNLHGNYFDLRLLPRLSSQTPFLLTLHDAWLLSGHCAHSFACERWKTGCGQCPDLTILPPIPRDATAYNWQRKRDIYAQCRLYVATPSRWLMQKVEQSILQPAIIESRIIPNGVDLSVFQPGSKPTIREKLGITANANMICFTANTIRQNPWKDYHTLQTAIALFAEQVSESERPLLFIALGDTGPDIQLGQATIKFVPYQNDPKIVVQYYQAADIYLHAARADTFPNTVLEALACGTPVVATAVGGIPEQVDDAQTGLLVPQGDPAAMAASIQQLLKDKELHHSMSRQAAIVARQRFSLEQMAHKYLNWYQQIEQAFSTHISRQ